MRHSPLSDCQHGLQFGRSNHPTQQTETQFPSVSHSSVTI